jgi:hypothetical protein
MSTRSDLRGHQSDRARALRGLQRNSKIISASSPLKSGEIAQSTFDSLAMYWIVAFLFITTVTVVAAPHLLFYGEF